MTTWINEKSGSAKVDELLILVFVVALLMRVGL